MRFAGGENRVDDFWGRGNRVDDFVGSKMERTKLHKKTQIVVTFLLAPLFESAKNQQTRNYCCVWVRESRVDVFWVGEIEFISSEDGKIVLMFFLGSKMKTRENV